MAKKYKIKTHSGAKKRFKTTKSGRIKRDNANRNHILTKRTTKRKRGFRKTSYVDGSDEKVIHQLIPYK